MNIKNQKVLILGMSKSGYSAAKYLLSKNNFCYIYEDYKSAKTTTAIEEISSLGGIVVLKEEIDEIIEKIDILVISPGVKINHEIAVKCKQKSKRIISELEFGYNMLMPEIIAVTGTNGKTTTVSLLEHIYKSNGNKTFLLGNVGKTVTSHVDEIDKDSVCITEISSFQLESTTTLNPHIACILNITPDHLERHFTFDNYAYLKKRIFKNQRESEYTVLNFDDQVVKECQSLTQGKVVWISKMEKVKGAYRINGKLYYNDEMIIDEKDLSLKGEHNVENALFCIACAKIDGISNSVINKALSSFNGIEHRLELVGEVSGVKFYNDSKSTNTASTIVAIDSVKEDKILLLGGKEKGENYDNLLNAISASNVKQVILYGESRFNMINALKNYRINVTLTNNFSQALKISAIFAEKGQAILLSPACSSLDEFSCFEERGNEFKKFVESLK